MESKLKNILSLPHRLERSAALAQWLQGLYDSEADRPILVGGAAVELLTGSAYLTEDLDFVGTVTPLIARALKEAGFGPLGRHWIHERARVYFAFHDKRLQLGEKAVEWSFGRCRVLMVSPEDLLVDRLSAWQNCGSPVHGIQAYLLYHAVHGPMDAWRLQNRAAQEKVEKSLESVVRLFFRSRGRVPGNETLGAWASRGTE